MAMAWHPIDPTDTAEAAIHRETHRGRKLCGVFRSPFICTRASDDCDGDHVAYGIDRMIAATWYDDGPLQLAPRLY